MLGPAVVFAGSRVRLRQSHGSPVQLCRKEDRARSGSTAEGLVSIPSRRYAAWRRPGRELSARPSVWRLFIPQICPLKTNNNFTYGFLKMCFRSET